MNNALLDAPPREIAPSQATNRTTPAGLHANAGRDRGGAESLSPKKLNIPGDRVNKATADLPDEQRSLVRWLHAYYDDHDFTLDELAAKLKQPNGNSYSRASLYALLTGRRAEEGIGVDKMCAAIKAFKHDIDRTERITTERGTIKRIGCVATTLAKKIWKLCHAALIYQKIVFIWSDSQIGKTFALLKYAADHNHGETIYVRVPEGGALYAFMEELAVALRISPQQKIGELRRRIIDSFDDRMLMIVDEIHNCYVTGDGKAHVRVGEFIREIHDRTRCGVLICGTYVGQKAIFTGKQAELTKQLRRRALGKGLHLPALSTEKDLAMIAEAYGLPSAAGEALKLQKEINEADGLGVWMTHLQAASRIASKRGQTMTWAHVVKAADSLKALEKMQEEQAA
jgi:DNA transposition AAA+ family ATPase